MPETEPETFTLEQAAESLGVSAGDVRAYIEEGLVAAERGEADRPVLSRATMRRLWSVVTLHRDLGINLAGVSAVLRLREQYERVRRDLATLVEIVERELGPDAWDRLWPDGRPTPHANVAVEDVTESAGPRAGGTGDGPGEGSAGGSRPSGDAGGSGEDAGAPPASADAPPAQPPDQDAET